jgi:hypothetical protein
MAHSSGPWTRSSAGLGIAGAARRTLWLRRLELITVRESPLKRLFQAKPAGAADDLA